MGDWITSMQATSRRGLLSMKRLAVFAEVVGGITSENLVGKDVLLQGTTLCVGANLAAHFLLRQQHHSDLKSLSHVANDQRSECSWECT